MHVHEARLASTDGKDNSAYLVVISGPVLELTLLHYHGVGGDSVEEVLAVGNDDENLGVGGQVIFQPHAGLEVQVVGWLREGDRKSEK